MDNKDAPPAEPPTELVTAPDTPSDPEAVQSAAPAPDPDTMDFRIRDFTLSGGTTTRRLAPYEPLRPGLWLGFQEGATVQARHGTSADGRRGLMLSIDPGPSAWVSLELQLDEDALMRSGAALITLEAAASPLSSINMVLRMPRAGAATGFWDTRPETAVFNAGISRKSLAFFPQLSNMEPHDGFKHPLLIAFLPLRKTDLFLADILAGPVC